MLLSSEPTAKYHSLLAVLHEAKDNRPHVAREVLGTLVDHQLDRQSDDDVRYFIFANALAKRLDSRRAASINLYLQEYETPQIELFNLVARHLPTVGAAGAVANRLLARHLANRPAVTLLDIGIGTARQEVALLHEMAREGTLPEQLTVIAIEPNAHCLAEAQRVLRAAADELRLDLRFRGICAVIEDLTAQQWATLRADESPLVVHAAFAMHHIRDTRTSGRDDVFARLRALDADAVILCEPNADHHTESFFRRFESAWDHFSRTFRLIDGLDVSPRERRAMKLFFTREIEDILANDEGTRCERHEPSGAWVERLTRSGFYPASDLDGVATVEGAAIAASAHEGYVGLDFEGTTLVSILCATRAAQPAPVERERRRRRGVTAPLALRPLPD
ncbi:MAG: GAI protein2C [Gemmatimonadaceae bacterium]|nr:GAI protein2C [Gemmatimonadaceae bacterium]NUQ93913.1 GAI protein2C [Gemmatimonadaceae bacterium]NUR21150.1 GAI protein2C [Gemmatimonadaceae bacterium]NUS97997.1 GAI protein2C [Gemmatimonadaceae bacterium]